MVGVSTNPTPRESRHVATDCRPKSRLPDWNLGLPSRGQGSYRFEISIMALPRPRASRAGIVVGLHRDDHPSNRETGVDMPVSLGKLLQRILTVDHGEQLPRFDEPAEEFQLLSSGP